MEEEPKPPLGIKYITIPFDLADSLNPALMRTKAFKNIKEIMKKEYYHSKNLTSTEIGGRPETSTQHHWR